MKFNFNFSAISDVGIARKANQDSVYASQNLLVVCDGMGGHAAGDLASAIVTSTFSKLDSDDILIDKAPELIKQLINEARDEIIEAIKENPEFKGMGTTLALILKAGDKIVLGSMGDSRIYRYTNGEFSQISHDHSYVQELVDRGDISPSEAEDHPQKHFVTRVIGDFDFEYEPDVKIFEPKIGDKFLICSDGLSGFVSDETIESELKNKTPYDTCHDLVQLAIKASSNDNISVVVGEVQEISNNNLQTPTQSPQIGGSVAQEYEVPTEAEESPAQKAAALYNTPTDATEEDNERNLTVKKFWTKGKIIFISVFTSLVIILSSIVYFGLNYISSQYFLGIFNSEVTIYKGIQNSIFGIPLYEVQEIQPISIHDLDDKTLSNLKQGIYTNSLLDAQLKAKDLLETINTAKQIKLEEELQKQGKILIREESKTSKNKKSKK